MFLLLLSFAFVYSFGVTLPPNFSSDVSALFAAGKSAGTTGWDRLAYWTDLSGPRVSGSQQLENAIDLLVDMLKKEGFSNVHTESAMIPKWERGNESLYITFPYRKRLELLGLGTSVGGIVEAETFVVETFDELLANASRAVGKIVVFNPKCDWEKEPTGCYGRTVEYRSNGASVAAKCGAVASLIRSITGRSLYTPHTGVQEYADGVKQIPTACITVEDAEFFARMQARGAKVTVRLEMGAKNYPMVKSRNVIAEIVGSEKPNEYVFVGGHVDSWDVGQGAEDDGAGVMVTFEALSLLKKAGLRPKRTIRFIGWVCEEFGGYGAQQYFEDHKSEAPRVSIAMESDLGIFKPFGLEFSVRNSDSVNIMKQIMSYASVFNASQVVGGGGGEDSGPWLEVGVPGAAPYNDNKHYFDTHHTNADMMTHVPKDTFEQSSMVWALAVYGVSQLSDLLPRDQ